VLLPSRELLLSDELLEDIAPRLKKLCDDLDIPANRRRLIQDDLQNAVYFQGIDFLQPLLHPGLETIFDYIPAASPLVLLDPEAINYACLSASDEVEAGVAKAAVSGFAHSPAGELFLGEGELNEIVSGRHVIELTGLVMAGGAERTEIAIPCQDNSDLRVNVSKESSNALAPLARTLRGWLDDGEKIAIVCHQLPQAERLKELLTPYKLPCFISEAGFGKVISSSPDGAPASGELPFSWATSRAASGCHLHT